ncbi:MAG: cytochrome c oxidase subunit II [Pseudomonadota bacterium]
MPDGQVNEYEAGIQAASFPNDFVGTRKITKHRHLELSLVDQDTGAVTALGSKDYEVEGFGEEELIITLADPVPSGSRLRVVGGRSRVGQKPLLGLFGKDKSQIVPAPTVTIKAEGFQWGWTYSYPEHENFEFDALIAPRDTVPSHLYRLATTNDIVVPVGETIRLVTTARDVIHAWAIPAFAVKIDAIPGRLNETWFYTEHEGTYYGQCSEICGIDHAFMPISVRVVSRDEYEAWVDQQLIDNGLEPAFSGADQLAEAAPSALAVN